MKIQGVVLRESPEVDGWSAFRFGHIAEPPFEKEYGATMVWLIITLNALALFWVTRRVIQWQRRQILNAFTKYARLKFSLNYNFDALDEKALMELVCRELHLRRLEVRLSGSRILVADGKHGFSIDREATSRADASAADNGMIIRSLGATGCQLAYVFAPDAPPAEAPVVAACLDAIFAHAAFAHLEASAGAVHGTTVAQS